MDIQHRDIPDEGRHELKGSSTAIVGSVPISDGVGSTSFQKLGVMSLTGSIPTSVPDVQIVTDGTGGFKAASSTYSHMRRTTSGFLSTVTFTDIITPQGVFINGLNFRVQTSGVYFISIVRSVTTSIVVDETSVSATLLIPTNLYRRDSESIIGSGGGFLTNLSTGIDYGVLEDCTIAVMKV